MGSFSSKTSNSAGSGSGSGTQREVNSPCLGPGGLQFGLINSSSSLSVTQGLTQIQSEVWRQTRTLQQVSGLTYEAFLATISELNDISGHFLDSNGKQLVFAVKKGTDSSFLWKATVRIACVKVDSATKAVESFRCLNLKQYLKVYNSLRTQSAAVGAAFGDQDPKNQAILNESSSREELEGAAASKNEFVNARLILDELCEADADPNSLDECCICLERKPDVILPCTHSYCLPCIEQWNVDHKTCPVCRETLSSTDDGWVISEGPDSLDVATEIQKSLMDLAH